MTMIDQETIAVYDKQIGDYVELVKRDRIDPSVLKFIKRIVPGGHVLDLGCGPATASAVMRDNGLKVDPVDASDEMVKLANRTHDIGARQAYFNDIKSSGTYDGIWASFSLLHATAEDFPTILVALHRSLKPGGIFHIGMKTGDGAARDKLGRYYTYYSKEKLHDHLENAGFHVIDVRTGEAKGLAGDVEPWILVTCSS